jgi:hypothetical protein
MMNQADRGKGVGCAIGEEPQVDSAAPQSKDREDKDTVFAGCALLIIGDGRVAGPSIEAAPMCRSAAVHSRSDG